MTGWEPSTLTFEVRPGVTKTIREPEWDWVDLHIMAEWEALESKVCNQCGYPMALHVADVEDAAEHGATDPVKAASELYGVSAVTCPAMLKLDEVQARVHKSDEKARENGRDPDRARRWIFRHRGDPAPDFHEHPEAL